MILFPHMLWRESPLLVAFPSALQFLKIPDHNFQLTSNAYSALRTTMNKDNVLSFPNKIKNPAPLAHETGAPATIASIR